MKNLNADPSQQGMLTKSKHRAPNMVAQDASQKALSKRKAQKAARKKNR